MSFSIIEKHCPEFLRTHEVIMNVNCIDQTLLLLPLELRESKIARDALSNAKSKYTKLFEYLDSMNIICDILPTKYLYKEKEALLADLENLFTNYSNLLKDMNKDIAPYIITYQKIENFDILIMVKLRDDSGYFEDIVGKYKVVYTNTLTELISYDGIYYNMSEDEEEEE